MNGWIEILSILFEPSKRSHEKKIVKVSDIKKAERRQIKEMLPLGYERGRAARSSPLSGKKKKLSSGITCIGLAKKFVWVFVRLSGKPE